MKTINSLSGGKTSSYIAANYPADYNVFALIRTDDKNCIYPDEKVRQIVSEKIGKEFIGTLEDDTIIRTMLDLEQFIGNQINWISGLTFDELCKKWSKGKKGFYIPNASMRFCTIEMKIKPIMQYVYDNINEPVEMRIGYRANEQHRAAAMLKRCDSSGFEYGKVIIGRHKNGNNKWGKYKYRKPTFPLITNNIYRDQIEIYWKDKNVKFAFVNNCVGCFHSNLMLLKKQSDKNTNKFDWFIEAEKKCNETYKGRKWLADIKKPTYLEIKNYKSQLELFDDDFNECDSGYCGL